LEDAGASALQSIITAAEGASGWLLGGEVFSTRVLDEGESSAVIEVKSETVAAHIECEIHPSGWVCAEAFLGEAMMLRVWAEFDEGLIAFWPDGAPAVGESPGALDDENGLSLDAAQWPYLGAEIIAVTRIGLEG